MQNIKSVRPRLEQCGKQERSEEKHGRHFRFCRKIFLSFSFVLRQIVDVNLPALRFLPSLLYNCHDSSNPCTSPGAGYIHALCFTVNFASNLGAKRTQCKLRGAVQYRESWQGRHGIDCKQLSIVFVRISWCGL